MNCPDCGCRVRDHNAVNMVWHSDMTVKGSIAHCGGCGACWRSLNTPFVELVRKWLTKE